MALDPAVMTMLNAAIDEIERVARVGKDGDDIATAFVYSGGHHAELQKDIPALHVTQAGAVADWKGQAIAWLTAERAATFRFTDIPKIERLMMTEKEFLGMRIAITRYGVTSKIAVLSRKAEAEIAEQVQPEKARKAKSARREGKR